ncbi:hypothetical protein [Nostoc sp. CENA543]|uniref:hypothetical protein n=1 Tax=Nostoc sp. CENA543 TaxID=1869241 RepID=UPI0012FFEB87|nr:hypothetical protein [Nostoc sp. CENA543]
MTKNNDSQEILRNHKSHTEYFKFFAPFKLGVLLAVAGRLARAVSGSAAFSRC